MKNYKVLSYANWRLLKTVKKMSFFRHFPWRSRAFNLLYPNISMHFLHTVLYTFPEVLTRRICLKIKSFISWWSFPWGQLVKTHRKVCFSNENAVMCSGESKQKVWAKDFPHFGSLVETKTNSFYLLHPNIIIHTLHTFFFIHFLWYWQGEFV